MVSEHLFSLHITRQEYLRYYAGDARSVQVRSIQGLLLQFPASALKHHVTHQGIDGHFIIKFDGDNKLIALNKIAD
ncbi:MAG: hypothetical protein ACI9N9_001895 [Enterobacterales bacterium]|jgi:hypothetical protein